MLKPKLNKPVTILHMKNWSYSTKEPELFNYAVDSEGAYALDSEGYMAEEPSE